MATTRALPAPSVTRHRPPAQVLLGWIIISQQQDDEYDLLFDEGELDDALAHFEMAIQYDANDLQASEQRLRLQGKGRGEGAAVAAAGRPGGWGREGRGEGDPAHASRQGRVGRRHEPRHLHLFVWRCKSKRGGVTDGTRGGGRGRQAWRGVPCRLWFTASLAWAGPTAAWQATGAAPARCPGPASQQADTGWLNADLGRHAPAASHPFPIRTRTCTRTSTRARAHGHARTHAHPTHAPPPPLPRPAPAPQALLGKAKILELKKHLGACMDVLTEVNVRFGWWVHGAGGAGRKDGGRGSVCDGVSRHWSCAHGMSLQGAMSRPVRRKLADARARTALATHTHTLSLLVLPPLRATRVNPAAPPPPPSSCAPACRHRCRFVPALVEKARLLMAMNDWDQVADTLQRILGADQQNIMAQAWQCRWWWAARRVCLGGGAGSWSLRLEGLAV